MMQVRGGSVGRATPLLLRFAYADECTPGAIGGRDAQGCARRTARLMHMAAPPEQNFMAKAGSLKPPFRRCCKRTRDLGSAPGAATQKPRRRAAEEFRQCLLGPPVR